MLNTDYVSMFTAFLECPDRCSQIVCKMQDTTVCKQSTDILNLELKTSTGKTKGIQATLHPKIPVCQILFKDKCS